MPPHRIDSGGSLKEFLEYVIQVKSPNPPLVKIPKNELLDLIKKYLSNIYSDADPLLVFENWEPALRRPQLIRDWFVKYNVYNQKLGVELVPSWGIIQRATELRGNNLRVELIDKIRKLTSKQFQKLMVNVFSATPWARDISITKLSRDGGIDFKGRYVHLDSGLTLSLLGQAKHWKSKVSSELLRTFIGSMSVTAKGRQVVGVYVSTGGFSDDAKNAIEDSPHKILSYDSQQLADLMIRYRIGIRPMEMKSFSMEETFWDELEE